MNQVGFFLLNMKAALNIIEGDEDFSQPFKSVPEKGDIYGDQKDILNLSQY